MKISGKLVDIYERNIYQAEIFFDEGIISKVEKTKEFGQGFILPGLIDAHVHIESSMLTPGSFALASVPHGTIGVVSDPHEIANVMGISGVEYMIEDGNKVPFNFWFGAPSCVPATRFETNGANLDSGLVEELIKRKEIKYLAEMMNFPGVIFNDEEVIRKLNCAKKLNKKIDGHAPGLSGSDLIKYVNSGITTDHECSTIEEAIEKLKLGMKILIREEVQQETLEVLKELYTLFPNEIMLCSDDLHPEMLEKGHINRLIAKLICEGYNKYDVIRSATYNPSEHYKLGSGLLKPGQKADFTIVDTLDKMNVLETWIGGTKVYDRGEVLFEYKPGKSINNFNCTFISDSSLVVKNSGNAVRVIEAIDGELLTKEIFWNPGTDNIVNSDTTADILKIVVKDRYTDTSPAVAFIKGFGLKQGAFASSVAHDSHNIIAIGTSDIEIVKAINEIVRLKGGLVVSGGNEMSSLKLNVGGIMSDRPCREVASEYEKLSGKVKELGCLLSSPFMTLSFMALLVIPELKLSDRGLFSGKTFSFVPLFLD